MPQRPFGLPTAHPNETHIPPTPSERSSFGGAPPRIGSYDGPILPDEAPPSYEDAMAEDIPPFDGPRRDYNPPPSSPVVPHEKGSGVSRRVSERLFPATVLRRRDDSPNGEIPPEMPPRPSLVTRRSSKNALTNKPVDEG